MHPLAWEMRTSTLRPTNPTCRVKAAPEGETQYLTAPREVGEIQWARHRHQTDDRQARSHEGSVRRRRASQATVREKENGSGKRKWSSMDSIASVSPLLSNRTLTLATRLRELSRLYSTWHGESRWTHRQLDDPLDDTCTKSSRDGASDSPPAVRPRPDHSRFGTDCVSVRSPRSPMPCRGRGSRAIRRSR